MTETSTRQHYQFGEPVRVACSATGRYVGHYMGKHWALFVSAQDNDLCLDEVNGATAPQANIPLPCDQAIQAASTGMSKGLRLAAEDKS